MEARSIAVLLVEDSATTRLFLTRLLESDPHIRVVGAVGDGQEALEFVARSHADVVLMDINMPRLDGFEATRIIMESHPLPIVICSATVNVNDTVITFHALEAGAIACVAKPTGPDDTQGAETLLRTIKLMSEVKVVRRHARARAPAAGGAARTVRRSALPVVGIGASTGGPPVLQAILAGLPKDFPAPIAIVQHIASGFLAGMAQWLNQTTPLQIHVASHGLAMQPGHVYLAPDDFHMGVAAGGTIALSREAPDNHLRPSVSFLFRSLAEVCGPDAVGVLLTGMGRDGADALKTMRERGAVTIAQDRESSAVHGMPGAAIEIDAATHVLPAERIADTLVTLLHNRTKIA